MPGFSFSHTPAYRLLLLNRIRISSILWYQSSKRVSDTRPFYFGIENLVPLPREGVGIFKGRSKIRAFLKRLFSFFRTSPDQPQLPFSQGVPQCFYNASLNVLPLGTGFLFDPDFIGFDTDFTDAGNGNDVPDDLGCNGSQDRQSGGRVLREWRMKGLYAWRAHVPGSEKGPDLGIGVDINFNFSIFHQFTAGATTSAYSLPRS